MFIPNIRATFSDEQRAHWLPRAEAWEVVGCYAGILEVTVKRDRRKQLADALGLIAWRRAVSATVCGCLKQSQSEVSLLLRILTPTTLRAGSIWQHCMDKLRSRCPAFAYKQADAFRVYSRKVVMYSSLLPCLIMRYLAPCPTMEKAEGTLHCVAKFTAL